MTFIEEASLSVTETGCSWLHVPPAAEVPFLQIAFLILQTRNLDLKKYVKILNMPREQLEK